MMPLFGQGASTFGWLEKREISMNKADVVRKVAEKTSIEPNSCEKIIKAFEEQAGDALAGKLKGIKTDHADLLVDISGKTGLSREDCEGGLTALEDVVSAGVSDKLGFLGKMFSR
jgi:hypothetical protein